MTRQKMGRETARNRVGRDTIQKKRATGREWKEREKRLRRAKRDSECCDASLLCDSLTPQIKLKNEDK